MKSDIPMDIMRMGATLLTNVHVMLRAAKTGRKAGMFTKRNMLPGRLTRVFASVPQAVNSERE